MDARTRLGRVRHRLEAAYWPFPTSSEQAQQIQLQEQWRSLSTQQPECLPGLSERHFRAYSQNSEDGILLYIFAMVGAVERTCLEICAGDGIECNSANLLINHGWTGLLIDGDAANVRRGRAFYKACPDTRPWPPAFKHAWVTAENVNDVVSDGGLSGEIDLFSLDIDGVDYWVWKALTVVEPRVVVVEYQDILGPDQALTVPYDPNFRRESPDNNYQGASLAAMAKLGREKGYHLIGVENFGFNAFFLRDDLRTPLLPEMAVGEAFAHPKVRSGMKYRQPLVASRPWVEV